MSHGATALSETKQMGALYDLVPVVKVGINPVAGQMVTARSTYSASVSMDAVKGLSYTIPSPAAACPTLAAPATTDFSIGLQPIFTVGAFLASPSTETAAAAATASKDTYNNAFYNSATNLGAVFVSASLQASVIAFARLQARCMKAA